MDRGGSTMGGDHHLNKAPNHLEYGDSQGKWGAEDARPGACHTIVGKQQSHQFTYAERKGIRRIWSEKSLRGALTSGRGTARHCSSEGIRRRRIGTGAA